MGVVVDDLSRKSSEANTVVGEDKLDDLYRNPFSRKKK